LPGADWTKDDVDAILDLADLEPGWDGDDAPAIDAVVISSALRIVRLLSREYTERIAFASPGPSGEVMLLLRRGLRETEIIIYPTRAVYVNFNGKEFSDKGDYDDSKIDILMRWLQG